MKKLSFAFSMLTLFAFAGQAKARSGSKGEAITMKSKSFLWFITGLIAVFLTIPRIASAQDERRYEKREEPREREGEKYGKEDRTRLEGTWYLNGDAINLARSFQPVAGSKRETNAATLVP